MSKEIALNSAIFPFTFIVIQQRRRSHLQKEEKYFLCLLKLFIFFYITEQTSARDQASIYMIILFRMIGRNQNKKILFREIINKNVDLLLRFQQKKNHFCLYYSPFLRSLGQKVKEF